MIKNKSNTISFLNKYDIVFILLLIVVATFPLVRINPPAIFSLLVLQFGFSIKKIKKGIQFKPYFWVLLAVFLLNIFGVLYSSNINKAFTIISRQSIIILFPLFYSLYYPQKTHLIFKVYTLAIAVYIIAFEINTLYYFFYKSDVFPLNFPLFFSYRYTGAELTKLIGMHNAYFGMYIIFSNVLIISYIKKTKENYKILVLILMLILQSFFIFQMVAKTAILLNIAIVTFYLIIVLIEKKKIKTIIFSAILFIIFGWFLTTKYNLPLKRIQNRFVELVSKNNTRRTRFEIWETTFPIIKSNMFLGVGTGDAETVFHNQFLKQGKKASSNTHNQYLDYLIRFGFLGLSIFLFSIIYALYFSIKTKNHIYLCFTLVIAVSCLTENILSRQWGITFYSYFNYLLYLKNQKN